MAPKKYIEKVCDSFEHMFGHPPKTNVLSSIEKSDHQEIKTSELFDLEWIKKYQSCIRALQWVVSIGSFDIQNAVMTLSSFIVATRRSCFERVNRIYGYLSKIKLSLIRIRVQEKSLSCSSSQV